MTAYRLTMSEADEREVKRRLDDAIYEGDGYVPTTDACRLWDEMEALRVALTAVLASTGSK